MSEVENSIIACGQDDDLKNGIWPRSLPLWSVAIYMAFFIIRPWEKLTPWLAEVRFELLVGLFMVAVVLFSKKKRFKSNTQNFFILVFAGALGLSFLFAWKPSLSWEFFYQYLTFIVFYFILISVVRTPYELLFIITCYISIMGLYLGKSQWEYFIHGAGRYDMGVNRMWGLESTYGYPNAVAQSIVLSLPMLGLIWACRNEFSAGWPDFPRKWFPRLLLFYFWLAISSILLTNSRIGMLGAVLFVVLTSLRGKNLARQLGCILLCALMLGVFWQFMPEENRNRLRTVWNPAAGPEEAQVSAKGRIEGLKAGVAMFKTFPVSGVGIGNFKQYRLRNVDGVGLNAHNLIGQLLGETGFVGATAFILIFMTTFANCRKVKRMGRGSLHAVPKVLSRLALACGNSIILLLFMGMTSHNLLRYNWLWVAAFAVISTDLMNRFHEKHSEMLGPVAGEDHRFDSEKRTILNKGLKK